MDVVTSYLELCLRLGRHVDGLLDSYYGPSEIRERIDAEELRDPSALAEDAAVLGESLGVLEEERRPWLAAQLLGLETVARRLAGEEIDYEDEVEHCYGMRPQRVSEDTFEAAHSALEEALPGREPLAKRYQAWREGDVLHGAPRREV